MKYKIAYAALGFLLCNYMLPPIKKLPYIILGVVCTLLGFLLGVYLDEVLYTLYSLG
jgi:hypothetical protein